MKITRSFTFSCLALVVLAALSGQAFAGTYYVANPGGATGCAPGYYFTSINSAISDPAVPAGSTIKVCPGQYFEQVLINKKVTLEGVANTTQDAAVILPPAGGVVANATDLDSGGPIAAQVLVTIPGPVTISNLTVDGTGNNVNDDTTDLMGILFQNASGTVNHVAVRNQLPGGVPTGDSGYGQGIYVQTASGNFSTVTVENSSVHGYNKNGITGNDPGTTLTVTGSYVQGNGALGLGYDAQNGIQIGFGAAGRVSSTKVIDNSYVGPTYGASSILLYNAAEVSTNAISNNIIGNSQIPIGLYDVGPGNNDDDVSVTGNLIFGSLTYDAIDACSNNNTITGNTIVNSAESGVHLDGTCGATGNGNTVSANTFLESACAGILEDSGEAGNTIGTETYYSVPFPITTPATACVLTGEVTRTHKLKVSPKR
jgi:parallel beta-helix repeat protein